jgi:hypothetical protein
LVIGIALLALLFPVHPRSVDEKVLSEQQALETKRKYKNVLITVNKLPEPAVAESVLTLDSLDEVIKVALALIKPINHVVDDK